MPCAVRVTAWGVGRAPDLSEELSVQVQRVACRAQIICCMDGLCIILGFAHGFAASADCSSLWRIYRGIFGVPCRLRRGPGQVESTLGAVSCMCK